MKSLNVLFPIAALFAVIAGAVYYVRSAPAAPAVAEAKEVPASTAPVSDRYANGGAN